MGGVCPVLSLTHRTELVSVAIRLCLRAFPGGYGKIPHQRQLQ